MSYLLRSGFLHLSTRLRASANTFRAAGAELLGIFVDLLLAAQLRRPAEHFVQSTGTSQTLSWSKLFERLRFAASIPPLVARAQPEPTLQTLLRIDTRSDLNGER